MKRCLALAALALLAVSMTAGAAPHPHTFTGQFTHPPAHSHVVVMTPDVQLSLLTAAGLPEARQDWSQSGRDNLAAALSTLLQQKGHVPSVLDPNTAMDGRIGQVIRLNSAVGASILAIDQYGFNLPTHPRNTFNWTLGDGAQQLASAYNADYALFITARGSYASSGRYAAMVGLAILGVGISLGGQQAFATLVDLHTGNVLWFNMITASPTEDMRDPTHAAELVTRLVQDAPL
jgi:hypothetical protein